MKRKVAVLIAFLGLLAGNAAAQAVKDVRAVLEASLKAMGGANLKTLQYSANGWSSRIDGSPLDELMEFMVELN